MVNFNSQRDIPNLRGKVILITGGSSGLGQQCVKDLAWHKPAEIWLGARNTSKAQGVAELIQKEVPGARIIVLELDLASFASINDAVTKFRTNAKRLDILMLNAGIMGSAPALTKEGYEIHFGTNHMGHALLTRQLMPILLESATTPPPNAVASDVRIVVVTSDLLKHTPSTHGLFESAKSPGEGLGAVQRYGQSKLANVLFARSLAKRYPQLTVAAVHPGITVTNLGAEMMDSYPLLRLLRPIMPLFFAGPHTGARNQLWAATSPRVKSGEFYYPIGVAGQGDAKARDDELAEQLWLWTQVELDRNGK
ncbi:NAD(P)-binding protein [Xylaria curta]|nr:NAD(P)-binding protein [Xylaria curta]